MSDKQRYRQYSKAQFEKALRLSSRFMPFPKPWDYVSWEEDDSGHYHSSKLKTPINEYCYVVPVIFDPVRILKVYSSVDKRTGYSRDIGGDAIRIVLADNFSEPKHAAFRRINRIQNWEWNLRLRISEALSFLGFDISCPKCGKELFMRRNSNTNERFLSCSSWPECTGSRNYASLNP